MPPTALLLSDRSRRRTVDGILLGVLGDLCARLVFSALFACETQ